MRYAITPDKFQPYWGYKYVVFSDGMVLFCDASHLYINHGNLRDEHPEATPVSAGQIKVRKNRWVITDGGSSTLKIPRMKDDEEHIGMELEKFGFVYDETLHY